MTVAQGTPMTDLFESEWDHYNFPMEALVFARELEAENAALSAQVVELQHLKEWLDNNTTYYDTAAQDRPVLASVSKRIWYHATDDTESYPFSSVIDSAHSTVTRASVPPSIDGGGTEVQHCCGVSGFAGSGDVCPRCELNARMRTANE